jgi:hypothetical protein
MYYNVTFIPASLKKFNGNNVTTSREGDIVLCFEEQEHKIDLFTVPEFRDYITEQIK